MERRDGFVTQVHPELVKLAQRKILKGEARLSPEQRVLWLEVYRQVGEQDVFLLLGLIGYILRGAKPEFVRKCAGITNYAIPLDPNDEEIPPSR